MHFWNPILNNLCTHGVPPGTEIISKLHLKKLLALDDDCEVSYPVLTKNKPVLIADIAGSMTGPLIKKDSSKITDLLTICCLKQDKEFPKNRINPASYPKSI